MLNACSFYSFSLPTLIKEIFSWIAKPSALAFPSACPAICLKEYIVNTKTRVFLELALVSKMDLETSKKGCVEENKLAGVTNSHLEGSGHSLHPGAVALLENACWQTVGKKCSSRLSQNSASVNPHLNWGHVVEEENQRTRLCLHFS